VSRAFVAGANRLTMLRSHSRSINNRSAVSSIRLSENVSGLCCRQETLQVDKRSRTSPSLTVQMLIGKARDRVYVCTCAST